ncbi:MAG: hypothetical protein ACOYL5_14410 [Phototrophicaceae bacterium]
MPPPNYAYQNYLLNTVSTQLHIPDIGQIAREAGVQAAIRITCHYPNQSAPDSVGTLVGWLAQPPRLEVCRLQSPAGSTTYPYSKEQFKAFQMALVELRFDRLEDQPNIPAHGVLLWLVERAAGGFAKRVLLAPELATDTYQTLIYRLHEYIPQAVEVNYGRE